MKTHPFRVSQPMRNTMLLNWRPWNNINSECKGAKEKTTKVFSVVNKSSRWGTTGHCQPGKEKVSASPSLVPGVGAEAPPGAQAQCHPTDQEGTWRNGCRPSSTLPRCLSCVWQGWQLGLGYNEIFNTSQRQLLLLFLSLLVQPLTDKSKKCVNFCWNLYFHYSPFNSSEWGHVVRLA